MNLSEIEGRLRRAGEISRGPGSMVERVMNEVAREPAPGPRGPSAGKGGGSRHDFGRLIMRIGIPAAMAACLVAAAVLWMMPARRASAAEQLQEVVEAAGAYKGWVHVTGETPPDMPVGVLGPGIQEFSKRVTYHTHAGAGITAEVREFATGADVTFSSAVQREMYTYDHKSNELRVVNLTETGERSIRERAVSPTTVAELLAVLKKEGARQPLSVNSVPEGEGMRFEVVLFASKEEVAAYLKEHNNAVPRALMIRVNKEKQMTRLEYVDTPVGTYALDFTYGKPEIKDIYDLGVPRTAKVIDNRQGPGEAGAKEALKQLRARLADRAKKGFGNYTALLTQYGVNEDGTLDKSYGYAKLFAVQDAKWVIADYRLMNTPQAGRQRRPETVLTEAPAGWPAPDVEKLLPVLLKATSIQYWVWNGKEGWMGSLGMNDGTKIDLRVAPYMLGSIGLVNDCWPGQGEREGIADNGRRTLVQDEAHGKLAGIRTHEDPDPRSGRTRTTDTVTWWDPARDDLPTEYDTESYEGTDKNVGYLGTQTRYLEFGQLAGTKQWYPVHWQETRKSQNMRTRQVETSVNHYRLQILPGLKLGEEWFGDPRGRAGGTGMP